MPAGSGRGRFCVQSVVVHATGERSGVPALRIHTGFQILINDRLDPASESIENCERHLRFNRKFKSDGSARIEWVWIVLRKSELSRHRLPIVLYRNQVCLDFQVVSAKEIAVEGILPEECRPKME